MNRRLVVMKGINLKIKEIERDRERGHTVVDEECQDDSACSSNAAFEEEGSAADGGATGEAHA